MKKYLAVLLFFLLIAGVSATEDIDFSDTNTTVTLDGVNFNIPAGFGELKNLSVNEKDENGVVKLGSFFTNPDNDLLMVSVVTANQEINGDLTNYLPENVSAYNRTIDGHDGIRWQDSGEEFFLYVQGNDVVIIEAPSESYFEDMIL